jgi:hypothetical protein
MATHSAATLTRRHTATPAFAAWVAPELCVKRTAETVRSEPLLLSLSCIGRESAGGDSLPVRAQVRAVLSVRRSVTCDYGNFSLVKRN